MGATLEIRDLTLRFGGVTALHRLRLSLAPGTVLGLAGPNGSGKSSLINVLTGHYRGEGSILLDSEQIDHLAAPERVRLGMTRTFQAPRTYRRMSVLENLDAACHAFRPLLRNRSVRRCETKEMHAQLERFGLGHLAHALPDQLTPVEQRLLELARAHVTGARLLLLDEPAAGTTEAEAHHLRQVMAEHVLPGRTAILIEHRLDFLRALCSELVVLQAGRMLAQGAPDDVFAKAEVRETLMGEPVHA